MRILWVVPLVAACAAQPSTSTQGSRHDETYDPPAISMQRVTTDGPELAGMALDDQYVYWSIAGQEEPGAVKRMARGGGPIETLASWNARVYSGIALDADAIYAVNTQDLSGNYAGAIQRVPLDGSAPTQLTTAVNPTRVAIDGDWVYYNSAVSPTGAIWRVAKEGGTPELVADNIDNPWDFAARDGSVYVSEMNAGRILRIDPGRTPVVLAEGWVGTISIAVFNDDVYFTAGRSGTTTALYRVPRAGGLVEQLSPESGAQMDGEGNLVVAGGSEVLWSGNVFALDGSAATPLVPSSVDGAAIAADENGAFMGDFYTGDIYRLW
jgi:hypothetical protein